VEEAKLVKAWHNFASAIVEAKQKWEVYQEERFSTSNIPINIPIAAMRMMASEIHRADFYTALPRLIDYWRGYGGVEETLVPSICSFFEQKEKDELTAEKEEGNARGKRSAGRSPERG